MGKNSAKKKSNSSSANFGIEAKLWLTADKLRNNMDAAEYKHVVPGLIFRTQFESAEGQHGGEFSTPCCVVRVLVEMLTPYKRRVYDPCCNSAGMFVQGEKFVEEHGGRIGDIAVYRQESNSTTRRLAMKRIGSRPFPAKAGIPCCAFMVRSNRGSTRRGGRVRSSW